MQKLRLNDQLLKNFEYEIEILEWKTQINSMAHESWN